MTLSMYCSQLVFFDSLRKRFVFIRMQVLKAMIFQFRLNPVDPHSIRQWRIDIDGFLGNFFAFPVSRNAAYACCEFDRPV